MDLTELKRSLTEMSPKESLSLILEKRQERKKQSQAWLHEKTEAPKRQAREKASTLITELNQSDRSELLRLLTSGELL